MCPAIFFCRSYPKGCGCSRLKHLNQSPKGTGRNTSQTGDKQATRVYGKNSISFWAQDLLTIDKIEEHFQPFIPMWEILYFISARQ